MIVSPLRFRAVLPTAFFLAIPFLGGCTQPESGPQQAIAPRPAFVATVKPGNAPEQEYVGEIRAMQRAELAFPVAGRVRRVLMEAGDAVRKGQIIAELDDAPMKAQVQAAAADVARSEAQWAESQQRLARLLEAIRMKAASATEEGAARLEVATAQTALHSAQANQKNAVWSLAQARLRSPVDGVVGLRALEIGQAVGPGATVLAIDGPGRELVLSVPERLALSPGLPVTLRHGGVETKSRILRLASRVEAGGTRKAYVAVPDEASVGETWSVAISSKGLGELAPLVPLRAVLPQTDGAKGKVLRLAPDGRSVESAPIVTGAIHGDWIEAREGLQAGDRVIVAGAAAIAPGSRVKPVEVDH